MATNGSRNRNAGHSWEREGVKDFLPFYPNIATSRAVNRARDGQKVDLANRDESEFGRVPFNMQYKSYSSTIPYPKLLSEMPQDPRYINVIAHRQTSKGEGEGATKFMTRGKFAIMDYKDFLRLVAYRRAFETLMAEFYSVLEPEEKEHIKQRLEAFGFNIGI